MSEDVTRANQLQWTPNWLSRLAVLWAQNISTAEIARILSAEMGADVSKNAVIGAAPRSGCRPRPSPIKMQTPLRRLAGADARR